MITSQIPDERARGAELVEFLAIVAMCALAAVLYGIVHDQITARICVEYFTIGHPDIFGTDDPTLLGLGWGVIATWWVGVLLGVPLAWLARAGDRPKRDAMSLCRPVGWLLAAMAGCALVAGATGWLLADMEAVTLVGPIALMVPREKHAVFLAAAWAHSTSYLAGVAGGLFVMRQVWRSRRL
jgi:hypothetical protein